jgi:hypothetical protein
MRFVIIVKLARYTQRSSEEMGKKSEPDNG